LTAAALIAALDLPTSTRVDRRVPKSMLVEHGAPTPADKKRISEGIEEVHWIATLKPSTIGVPPQRDHVRDYSEIAVLRVSLRSEAHAPSIAKLLHRTIPYPVLLVMHAGDDATLSLAHKRRSQAEAAATVIDGEPVDASVRWLEQNDNRRAFLEAMSLSQQNRTDLFRVYQGWIDTVRALLVAQLKGCFVRATTEAHAAYRAAALDDCNRLSSTMAKLRMEAVKERRLSRQVELNLELRRIQDAYFKLLERL
jgi:hypothetical protein